MANIRELLNNVKYAIFGKDVRQSIHDAIEECYNTAAMDHDNANMEVKMARGTHKILNDRFNANENLISRNINDISKKMNKDTRDIAPYQINKNLGKFDQTYMTNEFLQQITGNTPVNSVPHENSIVSNMFTDECINFKHLSREIFTGASLIKLTTTLGEYPRCRYMVQFKTDGIVLNNVNVKWAVKINSGAITSATMMKVQLYGNTSEDLTSDSYGTIDLTSGAERIYEHGKEYVLEHTFNISEDNENKDPNYTVVSLATEGLVKQSEYDIEIRIISISINGLEYSVHNHIPYGYDNPDPIVSGTLHNNSIVRTSDMMGLIEKSEMVVMEENFEPRVGDIIDKRLSKQYPDIIYNGYTDDSTGLFVVLMFDIRQLMDTDLEFVKNNQLTIKFTSDDRVNSNGIGCQVFNNNNSNLSTITGGQMVATPNTQPTPPTGAFNFKRSYSGLTGNDRYIRLCLNIRYVKELETVSGIIKNIDVTLGNVDLSPFLYEIGGLPHNDYYIQELKYNQQLASLTYVDNKVEELNQRIDNIGGGESGGGTSSSSKWKNKKWCAVGDSITEKNFRANKNYHDYIKEEITCTVYNRGISGSGYQASNSIMGRINTLELDSDLITVFAGTNDYNHGTVPLGAVGDKTEDTLCGCIHLTFERLLNRFPTKTIAVFTPLSRSNCNGLNEVENNRGYTLGQLAECIKEIANKFGLPVLDLYKESNLHPWIAANNTMYFAYQNDGVSAGDGLHPNDKGQKLIGDKIKIFINSL